MRDLAYETKDIAKDYQGNPDLLTNQNLFARNRELLLNAYFCMLSSSYGILVAILRVVLENAFLMRLFKKEPQLAFEWLSKGIQEQFLSGIKSKYGKSGISDRKIKVDLNKGIFRELGTKTVRNDVNNLYRQLSDYSHPNFLGWTHLTSLNEGGGILQSIPRFSKEYTGDNWNDALLYAIIFQGIL